MRYRCVSLLATLTLVLVLSVGFVGLNGAVAAPGGGATTSPGPAAINITECNVTPDLTFCVEHVGTEQIVMTPSGNYIVQVNTRSYCITLTDTTSGEFVSQTCATDHGRFLLKDGETQESHSHYTFSSANGTETCISTLRVHAANGQVQYDDSTFACS